MPFADEQFDFILCFAVLEHVKRPWQVASEMCRVLKSGGTVIVDYPFMSPMHGYPHHYFNATPEGSRSLFEASCDITSVEIGWHHHPAVPLQWMLTVWRNGLNEPLAQAFSALTVGELIDTDREVLIDLPCSRGLHPDLKTAIAGGSTLTGVKRFPATEMFGLPDQPDPPDEIARLRTINAQLEKALGTIHASTSWRVTAPLRFLGRMLQPKRRG